jgi:predicted DNA-binding transcriptional regulator AlpA
LIVKALAWLLEEINKWMHAFFWARKDAVNGGQCLVAWENICKPWVFGDLGVKKMQIHGIGLPMRWEWLKRTDLARPWEGSIYD